MPVPEGVRGDAGGFDPRDCTTQAQHFDTSTAYLSRCTTVYWSFARRGWVWGIGSIGRGHLRCGLGEAGRIVMGGFVRAWLHRTSDTAGSSEAEGGRQAIGAGIAPVQKSLRMHDLPVRLVEDVVDVEADDDRPGIPW